MILKFELYLDCCHAIYAYQITSQYVLPPIQKTKKNKQNVDAQDIAGGCCIYIVANTKCKQHIRRIRLEQVINAI